VFRTLFSRNAGRPGQRNESMSRLLEKGSKPALRNFFVEVCFGESFIVLTFTLRAVISCKKRSTLTFFTMIFCKKRSTLIFFTMISCKKRSTLIFFTMISCKKRSTSIFFTMIFCKKRSTSIFFTMISCKRRSMSILFTIISCKKGSMPILSERKYREKAKGRIRNWRIFYPNNGLEIFIHLCY
jgi:hypothetical protein